MSSAIALWRSNVAVPKRAETITLLYPSASSPDSPDPPFVLVAVAAFISSLSMS